MATSPVVVIVSASICTLLLVVLCVVAVSRWRRERNQRRTPSTVQKPDGNLMANHEEDSGSGDARHHNTLLPIPPESAGLLLAEATEQPVGPQSQDDEDPSGQSQPQPKLAGSGAAVTVAETDSALSALTGHRPSRAHLSRNDGAFVPRIFISHSTHDDAFGRRLALDLQAALGDRDCVWYDSLDDRDTTNDDRLKGGQLFPVEIADQIASRNVFLVLVSPDATDSKWVAYEVSQILRRYNSQDQTAVIPVQVAKSALPNSLAVFQALDFTHYSDDTAYHQALAQLLTQIRSATTILSLSAPPFDDGLLPRPPHLVGRIVELDRLLDRLRHGGVTQITAINGMGGVGKTTLAAVAMRELRQEGIFPDGIALVKCEGLSDSTDVLRRVLARFTPGRRQPEASDTAALAQAAEQLLSGRHALVVLDNIEPTCPIEEITAVLSSAGATVLLTARHTLSRDAVAPDGVMSLGLLSPSEALQLFEQNFTGLPDSTLSPGDRRVAEKIVTLLDRHTLAVILAGRYAAELHRPLERLEQELAADLLSLPEGEVARKLEAVLARSVGILPPDGQLLFTGLATFTAGAFGRQAAIAVARTMDIGVPKETLELMIRRGLAYASLDLTLPADSDRERLQLHPLVRAYADQLFQFREMQFRTRAFAGLAQHYIEYFASYPDSVAVYLAESSNVTNVIEWAYMHGEHQWVSDLCFVMGRHWRDLVYAKEGLKYLPWAIDASERLAQASNLPQDWLQLANVLLMYSGLMGDVGDPEEALPYCEKSLSIFRELNDRSGEGRALNYLGDIAWWNGRTSDAEEYFQQALAIARELGNAEAASLATSNLVDVELNRGHPYAAARYIEQTLPGVRERGDLVALSHSLTGTGWCSFLMGELDAADAAFREALAIDREIRFRAGEGTDLQYLAEVALSRGKSYEAEELCREALGLAIETADSTSESQCLELLARASLYGGNASEMMDLRELLNRSLHIAQEQHLMQEEARARSTIGEYLDRLGEPTRAEAYLRRGLELAIECENDATRADILFLLGKLLIKGGNEDEGWGLVLEAEQITNKYGLASTHTIRAFVVEQGHAS